MRPDAAAKGQFRKLQREVSDQQHELADAADRAADAANGDGPSSSEPEEEPEADGPEPHPHPLSNDLVTDPLPPRSPAEQIEEQEGIGAAPRRILRGSAAAIALCIVIAFAASLLVFGGRWEVLLIGAVVFSVFLLLIGAPIWLAGMTKVAQDEAVRDARTPPVE